MVHDQGLDENGFIVTVRNQQLNIDVAILHPRNLVRMMPESLHVSAYKRTPGVGLHAYDMNESVALVHYALAFLDQNYAMPLI